MELCSFQKSFTPPGTGFRPLHWASVNQTKPAQAIAPYLVTHCVFGCLIGLFWGVLILVTDTGGIRELLSASAYPAATCALFLLGSVVAILPVVLATAIGRLATER